MLSNSILMIRTHLTKIEHILLWLIGAYLSYKLMVTGYKKFDPDGMWTKAFLRWGYPVWFRVFIGILEVVGGLLLLVPRTRHFGALILSVVMIGALATRLVFGTDLNDALAIAFNLIIFLYLAMEHSDISLRGNT